MSDLDLSALRKVAEAAAAVGDPHWDDPDPTVWKISGQPDTRWYVIDAEEPWRHVAQIQTYDWAEGSPELAEATHIASFDPATVLALLDELETLRAQVSDG